MSVINTSHPSGPRVVVNRKRLVIWDTFVGFSLQSKQFSRILSHSNWWVCFESWSTHQASSAEAAPRDLSKKQRICRCCLGPIVSVPLLVKFWKVLELYCEFGSAHTAMSMPAVWSPYSPEPIGFLVDLSTSQPPSQVILWHAGALHSLGAWWGVLKLSRAVDLLFGSNLQVGAPEKGDQASDISDSWFGRQSCGASNIYLFRSGQCDCSLACVLLCRDLTCKSKNRKEQNYFFRLSPSNKFKIVALQSASRMLTAI